MSISSFFEKKENIERLFSEKNQKRYSENKLTASDRINILLDDDSFLEMDMYRCGSSSDADFARDGVITGTGTINGRPVGVFSQDFRFMGGSLGKVHAQKIVKLQNFCISAGIPIIGIQDSGGARIQEGVNGLSGYGDIFHNNVKSSGYIPQISAIMGPCAGGAVYSPGLTDFIFMTLDSFMFITGPDVVKAVLNEEYTKQQLGGAEMHAEKSGVCDMLFFNEYDTLMSIRKLISYLPLCCEKPNPVVNVDFQKDLSWLNTFLSLEKNASYDMKDIINSLIDDVFFEIGSHFAKNIVTGFGRFEGNTVGLIANQPLELAGSIDIDASRKAARFIRFCDCFNIPIVTLVDVPGFLPGYEQERGGIIKHGAKLLYAYSEATVPKITIITRKAYGGAYIVMGSKHLGGDLNYAWPHAEIAVLGANAAANILYKNLEEKELELKKAEYEARFSNPYEAAGLGFIDDVIEPCKTRSFILNGLHFLRSKKSTQKINKKHDNLPL